MAGRGAVLASRILNEISSLELEFDKNMTFVGLRDLELAIS